MRKYDIGFLGGGQLARMSIQAAQRMGLRCLSLDPGTDTPASQIADAIVDELDNSASISRLVAQCEHITLENEFLTVNSLVFGAHDAGRLPDVFMPSPFTVGFINNKLAQRERLVKFGVPSPAAVQAFNLAGSQIDLSHTVERIGFPMVLKKKFGSYDGKGTRIVRNRAEFDAQSDLMESESWLAEEYVPFKRELAVMVCRSKDQTVCFPTMETVQTNHVCDLVFPAGVDASEVAVKAVEAVEGYGLFGVELFETEGGKVLVNEIAPRPHNTGHYTLDWGGISQFEAHVRLVLGLPIPKPVGQETCMANLLGVDDPGDYRDGLQAAIQGDPGVHVHWYGKAEARPGRKMGHINAVGPDCVARAKAARERFYAAWKRA